MLPLFTLTIFLGAVLVFGVQPFAARMLLPSLGGSPAVWSTTSLFFQVALLVGYGYSFVLTRRLRPQRQPIAHLVALAMPLFFLPLGLTPTRDAGALPPALAVLGLLTVSLGVPFAVTSTTGPLLQRWFSFTGHAAGRDPYFLYAASNAGSLLVLLAYPFLVEPHLTLEAQAAAWSIGYLSFAVLGAACSTVVLRRAPPVLPDPTPAPPSGRARAPAVAQRARWVLLAAVPSALSLGATAYITTDIAAVPLLWVAPLSLYLLSFIVAFSSRFRPGSRAVGRLLPWTASAVVIVSAGLVTLSAVWVIALHLSLLAVAATMCHTRLNEERPPTTALTEYYLLIAIGGAVGGTFVALVAPVIFDGVWEYPIAIGLALLLRPGPSRLPGRRLMVVAAAVVLTALVIAAFGLQQPSRFPPALPSLGVGVALFVMLLTLSSLRAAFALGVFALLAVSVWAAAGGIYTDRTFFGVYRVTSEGSKHSLVHGSTVHGMQHLDPPLRRTATTYYHRTGPIGQIFAEMGTRFDSVAIIGLGVGTLTVYGEPGQHFTFFEIDPAMARLARDRELFTFLADSSADVDIVVADGRLGLEADRGAYDLLVVDAFSSDAVPVHLLTGEALAAYAQRLAPGGIIALHLTNRYLDLEPVVAAVADASGMPALAQVDMSVSADERSEGKAPSTWVVVGRTPADLAPLSSDARWRAARLDPAVRPWTDNFSDIVAALR